MEKIIESIRNSAIKCWRSDVVVFCALLAAGGVLRLWYMLGHPLPMRDELYYLCSSPWLESSNVLSLRQPVLLEALRKRLLPEDVNKALMIGRCLMLCGSFFFVAAFWWLGRCIFNSRKGGILLMLFAAISPGAIEYGTVFLREGLFLPIAAWLLLLLMLIMQSSRFYYFVFYGLLTGMGFLLRKESIEWLVFLVLALLWHVGSNRKMIWRLAGGLALTLVSGVAAWLTGCWLCGVSWSDIQVLLKHNFSGWL